MKLRLPNKLVAALMAAMSATVFTTLSTGSFAYADPTTYNDLTAVDYFETNEHVYNTGKGTFYLETSTSTLSLTLTLNLKAFADYQGVHDYANAGYYSNFVTWTYNSNPDTTYGMADVATGYSGVNYSGVTGMWNGLPWTTGTNITFNDDFRANYADADGNVTLTITNNPTPNTGNVVVTAVNKTSGATQTLYTANGLRSGDYANLRVTAFTVNMNYVKSVTLNSESILNSSGFTAPKDYTIAFDKTQEESVGRVVFLGDSITHGVQDMSYRWDIFKTFVDNGIENEIAGPLSGYNSAPLNSDYNGDSSSSTYGGATFDNVHYAQASGRTHNMLTASGSGNSLGGSTGVNYGGVTSVKVGKEYNGDTYIMMMGTNDILSDGANTVDKMATVTNRLLGEGSLENGTWTNAGVVGPLVGLTNDNVAYRGEWGTMGKIIDNLKMDEGDTMYVLSIPTWAEGRQDIRVYAPYVAEYNEKLELWTKAYSDTHTGTIKYVDVNRGLIDKTLGGVFLGPNSFFRQVSGDYLHPNEQGALIVAGNLAQGMGIAGRTAGLARSAADGAGWTALGRDVQLNSGESERLLSNVFTEGNGYSVDFSAIFGNGDTDGWLNKNNALSIYIGDGTNAGALKLSEGYISWNDKLLFCQDNSLESNDRIRVAYHNGNAEQNISSGYYVWLGDMLIGQGLGNQSDLSFNGVTVYAAGADAAVKGLSYANTAYAPTSELMAGTPLITTQAAGNASVIETGNVLLPLFNHNNATTLAGPTDFSSATQAGKSGNAVYVASTTASGDVVATYGSAISGQGSWFAAQGGNNVTHTGDLSLQLTEGASGAGLFGVVNTGTAGGDVTVQVDGADLSAYSTAAGTASIIGAYAGNITGKFTAVMNSGTLSGGIMGGFENATEGHHIGSVDLIVNGGTIGGSILGGSKVANGKVDGNIAITITGGTITGGIVGTGTAGTVGGDVNITITGGTIGSNVTARDNSVTMTKENATANLTVEGNLVSIGGNISADNITFRNVETQEYSDSFDKFSGSVTAADTLTLDHYTAAQVGSSVTAQHVVLSGNSSTTIRDLTLTACTITAEDGSDVTLEGTLTLGNTATYTGTVYVADGLVFSMTDAALGNAATEYTYSQGTSGFRVIGSATLLTPGDDSDSRLKAVGGAALTETNVNTYTGAGALEGATFSYNAETGILSAAPVNQVGSGTYYVNDAVTYDTNTPAYAADALVINNGGTLTFATNLKDNVSVTVAESGAAIGINEGKHIGGVALGDGVTGFALSGAGELRLTSADAATMLTGVTGTGTMRLTQNAVLDGVGATAADPTKTLSTGTFIVGNGDGDRVQLQIGRTQTGGQYQNNYATIKSFSNVVLDNGKLWYHTNNDNSALTLNNLTVTSGGGEIYIEDSNAKATFNLNGTTTLQGNLSLISRWKDNAFVIANLTGDGNLSLGGTANAPQLQLNSFAGWSGTLTHTQGTARYYIGLNAANSTAHLSTFNVDSGTAQIRLKDSNYASALLVDSVTLGNDATMQAYYADWGKSTANYSNVRLEIGALEMSGANASLATTNHGGQISVGSITGTGTLTLTNTSSSNVHSTYILGGNATEAGSTTFSGTVVMHHNNNGGQRGMVVMLNDTYTMANADLQVKAVQTGNNRVLGVGISADHAKLGGLNDQDVQSGGATLPYSLFSAPSSALEAQFTDVANYFDVNDGTMRTLEITGSGEYSTGIRVMEGINLVMSGTGSQTFSGDMSRFNGSVAVNSGTLALTGTGLTLRGTVANAGTLTLSGEIAVNTDKLWNYEVKAPAEGNTYSDGANGYLENATMYLVKSNGGTVNGFDSTTFTGTTVSQDDVSGSLTFVASDTTTYYVNEALTYDNEKMGAAANLHIAKDAVLTANGAPSSAKVLMGEGTFNLATVTTAAGVALPTDVTLSDTDWHGIVHLTSGGTAIAQFSGANISALGNSNSWVEIENFKGYSGTAGTDTQTISANLILKGENALVIENGWNNTHNVTGDIKGTGNLVHNYAANTWNFTGDISEWTGAIQKTIDDDRTRATTLSFGGKATDINVTIGYTGNSGFAISLGDITNGASAYTFNKNVTATTLTPNGHVASISKDAVMTLKTKNAGNLLGYLSNHSIVGEGKVVLTGGSNTSADYEVMLANNAATDKDILTHYEITGDVHFNGSGSAGAANIPKAVVTIGAADGSVDAGLKVTRDLRLGNYAHMKVSDNTYLEVVGKLLLGHNADIGAYPGKLTINGGEVTLGSLAIQSTASSNSFVMNGGSLEFTGTGNIVTNAAGTEAVNTSSTTIQFNAGTLKATQSDWTLNHAATIGNVEINSTTGRTLTISNALSDAGDVHGTITKTGAGKLTLSGANTFTGDLTIAEGTLEVGFSKALGALNNGHPESRSITVAAGGVLDIHGTGGFDNTDAGTYAVTLAGGKLTNSGNDVSDGSRQLITVLTVNNESTVEVLGNDGSEKKRFGLIGGGYAETSLTLNADLVKTGTGTFMLNRTNITGNGSLVVREGTVQFRTNVAHGTLSSNIVMDGGAVTGVDANSVFLGKDISITSTNSSSSFSSGINTDGHVLTLGGTEALTLSGAISGSGSLVKDGANTMTLSSANSFTGTTTIKHGTLIGANSNALQSSVVTFSDVAEDRVLSFENNGSAINGTIAGLSGYRGTVKADTLTINVAEGGNYQFLHRYDGSITLDKAVLDVNKLVKQGAGTQVIGGEYTTARGFTDAGLVIANGVDVQGGSLHMKTRGVVTANFDVQAGATLLTTDDNANKTTAAASVKYDGKVTLHGTAENTATLNYADGSTNITNGLYVDGYGSVINKYDKNQFIGGLFNAVGTTSNDISFNRPDSRWDNTDSNFSAAVITASGDFTGTIHISNSMVKDDGTRPVGAYGLQVLGAEAQDALAGAVVDFTGDNVSVLSFRSGDTAIAQSGDAWTNNKMDGSVAGLKGTNGAVYANTLTINTADSAAYTYGGTLDITGLTKTGTGTQTLSGTGLSLGTVAVNGGTLALTGTAENMASFDSMAIANGATLDLTSVTGMFANDAAGSWAKFTDLASKATGEGTVLLPVAAGANDTYQIMVSSNGGNATLSTNYVMNHGVSFNNYNNYSNPGDNTGVVIAEGGSLTVNGALKLASGMKMTLNGGSLTADSLTLGHGDASQNYFGSVTMNSGAMTLNGKITLANSYAGNALNLQGGTFTYNADGNVFDDASVNRTAAVTIGGEDAEHKTTLVADGHSWTLNHDATLGHVTVQTANDGAVTIGTADTTTTLTGLIYNKGDLTLAGTVNVVHDMNTQDAYFTNGSDDHTYGYLDSVTMKVIELSSGSSEHINDVTWKLNGQSADWYGLSEVEYSDGLVLMQGPSGDNSKRWFMNTGAGATFEYTGAESQEMNSFIINAKNDAVLTLNTGDNVGDHLSGPIIVNDTTAAINIAAGTTLAAGKLRTANGGNAVLTGAGTFDLGSVDKRGGLNNPIYLTLPTGVSVGDAAHWTGAVSVSGTINWLEGSSLNDLANENSWVEFKGLTGVWNGGDTIDANIRFTDNGGEAAFMTSGGFGGYTTTFNGKISGTGTYYLTNYNGGWQMFKFNGDASAWTGTLKSNNTNATGNQIEISNAFGATLQNEAGNMQVTLSDAALAEDAFTGDLVVNGGTMNVNSALNSTQVDARINGGTLNIKQGGTMGSLYSNGTSTINIGTENGEQNVTLSVTRIELGDMNADATSTMTVQNNATLLVTGSTNNTNVDGYKTDSFVIGEWNANSTVNVKGTVKADKADLLIGDTGNNHQATVNIAGGTLAVKGVNAGSTGEGRNGHLELNITDGGKLILGADGYYTRNVTWGSPVVNTTVLNGTIGISADDVTVNKDIKVDTMKLDTQKYAVSTADGGSVEHTSGNGTINIGGNITVADEAEHGNVSIIGGGAVKVTGEGSIAVNTVKIDNNSSLKSGDIATITHKADSADTTLVGTTVTATGIRGTQGAAASTVNNATINVGSAPQGASLLDLADEVSYNIADVNLVNTNVVSYEQMTVSNVALDAASSITAHNGGTLEGSNRLTLSDTQDVHPNTPLQSNQLSGLTLQNNATLAITLNNEIGADLTNGAGFTVTLSNFQWNDLLNNDGDYVGALEDVIKLNQVFTVTATVDGTLVRMDVIRAAQGGVGNADLILNVVPEPSTSVLSLLALAGMAARRRRK